MSTHARAGQERALGKVIRTQAVHATLQKTRRKERQSLPRQKGYTKLPLRQEKMVAYSGGQSLS